jgi:hypothetical protein
VSNIVDDMKDSYVDDSKKHNENIDKNIDALDANDYMEGGALHLERLADAFLASAKRWEMIVYPSLFAFIILAGYGFFLIYSLTKDAHTMAQDMATISVKMDSISQNMVLMTQTLDSQNAAMSEMVVSMRGMNLSINQIRYDMSIMNQSVSRPMSFMNSFMPW